MATLLSCATGAFTSASTWALCNSTAELDAANVSTALTTSYVASSTFTPGAITIDAIAVRIATRAASPSGTMSVELYNSTGAASVAGTEVTVNVSDVNASTSTTTTGSPWMVFKFAAPVTLLAATAYAVRAKTSVVSQVNLYSSATTNWNRELRTTTTQAPAASDQLLICGEFTAAATSSSFVVTMDSVATTAYGVIRICNKGSLIYGTAASTNYYLKSQTIGVYGGGLLEIDNIPTTSTAVLEFNSASAAQHGLNIWEGATGTIKGPVKTNLVVTLQADEGAGQTVIGPLSTTAGWLAGDELVFGTTIRTASDCEKKTILTVDSGTQVTLTAGLTVAHSGTAPTQCKVANLTRIVKVRGVSAANTGYVKLIGTGIFNTNYTEYSSLGGNVAGFEGIVVDSTFVGTFTMLGCSTHDNTNANAHGIKINSTGSNTITITDTIIYNCANHGFLNAQTSGTQTLTNCYAIKNGGSGFSLPDSSVSVIDCQSIGNTSFGFDFLENTVSLGTVTGLVANGNSNGGIAFFNNQIGTPTNLTIWRNNNPGLTISNSTGLSSLTLDTVNLFGNATYNVGISGYSYGTLLFKNLTSNSGVTQTTAVGFRSTAYIGGDIIFQDCSFGATTAHATGDLQTSGVQCASILLYNTVLASSTEIAGITPAVLLTNYNYPGILASKHDGVAGAQRAWLGMGTVLNDTVIYSGGSGQSLRATPSSSTVKLFVSKKQVPVASAGTATVSVKVRKSVVGDGTAYNGAQPRLMLRRNPALGFSSDVVLATCTAAADGAFETLTATTGAASGSGVLEFYVDCDGTTGWINVDTFTTTQSLDPTDFAYWNVGTPTLGNTATGSVAGTVGNLFT